MKAVAGFFQQSQTRGMVLFGIMLLAIICLMPQQSYSQGSGLGYGGGGAGNRTVTGTEYVTSDKNYQNLTINAGAILYVYPSVRIRVNHTLTNNGTIAGIGSDSTTSSFGLNVNDGGVFDSWNEGIGDNCCGDPNSPTFSGSPGERRCSPDPLDCFWGNCGPVSCHHYNPASGWSSIVGESSSPGGSGGSSGSGGGGGGAAWKQPVTNNSKFADGGDGGDGGRGGRGGTVLEIWAYNLENNSIINSNGGNGLNGGGGEQGEKETWNILLVNYDIAGRGGGGGAGGDGGDGGTVQIRYNNLINLGTIQANGGLGGAGGLGGNGRNLNYSNGTAQTESGANGGAGGGGHGGSSGQGAGSSNDGQDGATGNTGSSGTVEILNMKPCFADSDLDGYGDNNVGATLIEDACGVGYADNNLDCDDSSNTIYPGATEILDNGVDEDCDGVDSFCCLNDRGNTNGDPTDGIDIADLTYLVGFMFKGGAAPPCEDEANVNGTGQVDISDLTHLVGYMFKGGASPAPCP